jgi:hypothetical protein
MDFLQHYTSRVGLEGIARSKTLWATDFFELNDKGEMIYAYIEGAKAAGHIAWNQLTESFKSKFPGYINILRSPLRNMVRLIFT